MPGAPARPTSISATECRNVACGASIHFDKVRLSLTKVEYSEEDGMNVKRFALSCVAVYVVYQVLGFLIHQIWLSPTYMALSEVWRPMPEMMSKMWIMWLTSALWTVLFCYIYTRGHEGGGVMEGVRYGLLMGIFLGIPFSYESHVIYPIPMSLAHMWVIATLIVAVACGVVLALVYRPLESGEA